MCIDSGSLGIKNRHTYTSTSTPNQSASAAFLANINTIKYQLHLQSAVNVWHIYNVQLRDVGIAWYVARQPKYTKKLLARNVVLLACIVECVVYE